MCCKNLALIKSGQLFTLLSDSPLQQESEPITCIYCMLFLKLPETMDKTVILVYNRNCGSTIVLIGSLWLAQIHESHTKAQIDCSPGNITSCPASYVPSFRYLKCISLPPVHRFTLLNFYTLANSPMMILLILILIWDDQGQSGKHLM